MGIHVKTLTDEKQRAALEALSGIGVEVVVLPEEDAEIHSLFLDQRRNDKMDNLGQLRHLFKLEGHVRELVRLLTAADHQQAQQRFNREVKFTWYYEMRAAQRGITPVSQGFLHSMSKKWESYEDVEKYLDYQEWRSTQ